MDRRKIEKGKRTTNMERKSLNEKSNRQIKSEKERQHKYKKEINGKRKIKKFKY